ncbi:MAG: 23S rRNA (adenine(2503)-C(2))-methyltransferase RlmN [Acidobacteria bacterium]|nr:23S rRNA (adenine(2503)-C(2))-methyltransferase RlmN [Acidobacteriota bacterium]
MTTRPWDLPAPEPSPGSLPAVLGLDRAALRALAMEWGEPSFRGDQIFEGLYRHRWDTWASFSILPGTFRTRLQEGRPIGLPEIVESVPSTDGSTKHVFRLADGLRVEGVHMPYRDRSTLCLSSQVGCAMGCTFCATGSMGIGRNLDAGEIVGQVLAMLRRHGGSPASPVNLVFMGMGEPLHNLDHVLRAFRILSDPRGLAISPRRITVSTSGLVPGIRALGSHHPRPRLAVSLNATTDAQRSRTMPVNRVWNLEALGECLGAFPLQRGERITLEYVLLRGLSDGLEDGRRLAAFAKRFPSKVNLIPFNATESDPRMADFQPPEESRIGELCRILSDSGLTVSVRRSRGQDVAGACGQLVRKRGFRA